MLQVENLSVRYGKIEAVREVSFQLKEQEIAALIGANGAGKSTVLKAISGLLRAKGGSVRLNGRELLGSSPDQIVSAGIVQVPEGRQVFAKMTVLENLYLGGYLTRNREQLKERIAYVEDLFPILKDRQNQKAGSLSGGEQQMLAIARALVSGGNVLLLDEPSLGLAPVVTQQVFSVIEQLRKDGQSILLIEQNAVDALEIADHAFIMECGQIVLEGPASQIKQNAKVQDIYLGGNLT